MTAPVRIGVLALQGAVSEHTDILTSLGASVSLVRKPADLVGLQGLVIPGGESTAIARLAAPFGLLGEIRHRITQGDLAVLGTCAGVILLADELTELGALAQFDRVRGLDITVSRNAYGNQLDSFESEIEISVESVAPNGAQPTVSSRVAFIRAPRITRVGLNAQTIAWHEGEPVGVTQGNLIGATFHPEITGADVLHRELIARCEAIS